MRNHSSLFISCAVAAVAVAGSATAAITQTVLDTFGGSQSISGSNTSPIAWSPTQTMTMGSWTGWNYFTFGPSPAGQSKQARASLAGGQTVTNPASWVTVAESSGTLSVSNAAGVGTPNTNDVSSGIAYFAGSNGSFNLAGLGDCFYFDNVTTGTGAEWLVRVTSREAGGIIFNANVTSGHLIGSRYFVFFSMFTSSVAGQTLNATTAGNVVNIFLGQRLTATSAATTTSTMTEFGMIPAPGAIALLGAAGLVGSHRRRS